MKKFFIAFSVLAALMFSVVPSQAVIGMPEVDVLGTDAIVPFITDLDYVNKTGLNTLIVFTDVKGGDIDFHYTVYNVRSETVYNDNLEGTEYDIVPTNAYEIIAKVAPNYRDDLLVDLDGDTVADHYAGYIWFDNNDGIDNNTVGGQFLFVDLAKGIASSCNIAMKEWKADLAAAFDLVMVGNDNIELFSPNAMMGALGLQDGDAAPTAATNFGIYPRYYIPAAGDMTWFIFWMSANDLLTNPLHIWWYDDEENYVSTNIPIEDELTIIDVEGYIPNSLFGPNDYPKEGWVDLTWATNTADLRAMEMLGWTFIQAFGTMGTQDTSWAILNQMWRWVE